MLTDYVCSQTAQIHASMATTVMPFSAGRATVAVTSWEVDGDSVIATIKLHPGETVTLITVMQLLRAATSAASHSCCGSKEEAPADQQEPEAGSKNPAREADSSVDRPPADL